MAWSLAVQNHLSSRGAIKPRWLFYVWALETDRTSAPIGIWSGEYDLTYTIDGTSRIYQAGVGGMVPSEIVYEVGTTIRTQRITFNGVSVDNQEMVMGRMIRGRRADLHLMFLDPFTEAVIGYNRVFKGTVNRAPIQIGAHGETSSIEVELISATRGLTKPLALHKSDSSQMARSGDRFRRYGSVANNVKTEWGEE